MNMLGSEKERSKKARSNKAMAFFWNNMMQNFVIVVKA
jgi:hypothetical protein